MHRAHTPSFFPTYHIPIIKHGNFFFFTTPTAKCLQLLLLAIFPHVYWTMNSSWLDMVTARGLFMTDDRVHSKKWPENSALKTSFQYLFPHSTNWHVVDDNDILYHDVPSEETSVKTHLPFRVLKFF